MTAPPIGPARLVREPLQCAADPLHAARWLRGEPRAVALSGAWAGGGVLLASHPVAVAPPDDDPFALLDAQPDVAADAAATPPSAAAGSAGWASGWVARSSRCRRRRRDRSRCRRSTSRFYDHVVRCDADGRWWFEALHTARAPALAERLRRWRARLRRRPAAPAAVRGRPAARPRAPGAPGHATAVAEGVERIAAGEVFQVNLCLRLDGALDGDLLDLWIQAAGELHPALRGVRRRRRPRDRQPLARALPQPPRADRRQTSRSRARRPRRATRRRARRLSAKDRAENVMIVDLMRNDLGRVCEYGSVTRRPSSTRSPAAGVWHLVSTVEGTLRADATDSGAPARDVPAGSVTGAPKVRALRVISELEATAREAYCGAIGICSPLSGLELNVAIRTFEARGGRALAGRRRRAWWPTPIPRPRSRRRLTKARGVAAAAGLPLDVAAVAPHGVVAPVVTHARPDPARGVLETLLVLDGCGSGRRRAPRAPARELQRPGTRAAGGPGAGRSQPPRPAWPAGACASSSTPTARTSPPARCPEPGAVALNPVTLPGGLGAHKWADRTLIEALSGPGDDAPVLRPRRPRARGRLRRDRDRRGRRPDRPAARRPPAAIAVARAHARCRARRRTARPHRDGDPRARAARRLPCC